MEKNGVGRHQIPIPILKEVDENFRSKMLEKAGERSGIKDLRGLIGLKNKVNKQIHK